MTPLVYLPVELIQLIAGWCPASDILALSRTCRHLNTVCNTAAVFEMSFQNHLPKLTSTAFKDKTALVQIMRNYIDRPRTTGQQYEGPRMTWLCLAVAVSRFPDSLSELRRIASTVKFDEKYKYVVDEDTEKSLRGLISFHATLPIWGYTTPWLGYTLRILQLLFISRRLLRCDSETFLRFSFVLAMNTLETHESGGPNGGVPYEYARTFLFRAARQPEFNEAWIEKQTWALHIMDFMARKIHFTSVHGGAGRPIHIPNTNSVIWVLLQVPVQLPDPKKIELFDSWHSGGRSKMENTRQKGFTPLQPRFPLITPSLVAQKEKSGRYFDAFCGYEWWSWYNARVRDLFRSFDEGEWCCSYVYFLKGNDYRPEPTLKGIRFRKVTANGEEYSVEVPDGAAPDAVRRMRGRVIVRDVYHTFEFTPRQNYLGEHRLMGSITPLGICGIDHGAPGIYGSFWLWRSEWMGATAD
ncbi:uncharacterized protein F4807DRAFT_467628 [Annulohypoxylon truncatum]|uniref:uncharacterized protein n=1 Tax=Annulohypoxylon truncatum TaxID=327061 RepID=UPI0020073715|nr:uncharacterized protein F4807DRAFT_467628 [Annulohypoxylon truncatum]KAI1209361.1 hypothetical protein F4807DRAFT_467628 [Annulohypoxylon truncatum]